MALYRKINFLRLYLPTPRFLASRGGANGRKPFGVPDDNSTEARAISSEDGMIGAHIVVG